MVPSSFFRVDNGHFDISDGCSLVPDQLLNYEVGGVDSGHWTLDSGHWCPPAGGVTQITDQNNE